MRMKRFAAVLSLASVLVIGASSSASAAGDPLHVTVCSDGPAGCLDIVDVSVQRLVPGSAVLCGQNQTPLPSIPVLVPPPLNFSLYVSGTICEQ